MILLPPHLFSHKIVRYIISGGTAALVSLGFLYAFTEWFGFWYLISSIIAFAGGFVVSFTLQKFWTFEDRRTDTLNKQLISYLGVAFGGLITNVLLMYFMVEFWGLWYILAQILSIGVIAIITFFIYQNLIF